MESTKDKSDGSGEGSQQIGQEDHPHAGWRDAFDKIREHRPMTCG